MIYEGCSTFYPAIWNLNVTARYFTLMFGGSSQYVYTGNHFSFYPWWISWRCWHGHASRWSPFRKRLIITKAVTGTMSLVTAFYYNNLFSTQNSTLFRQGNDLASDWYCLVICINRGMFSQPPGWRHKRRLSITTVSATFAALNATGTIGRNASKKHWLLATISNDKRRVVDCAVGRYW